MLSFISMASIHRLLSTCEELVCSPHFCGQWIWAGSLAGRRTSRSIHFFAKNQEERPVRSSCLGQTNRELTGFTVSDSDCECKTQWPNFQTCLFYHIEAIRFGSEQVNRSALGEDHHKNCRSFQARLARIQHGVTLAEKEGKRTTDLMSSLFETAKEASAAAVKSTRSNSTVDAAGDQNPLDDFVETLLKTMSGIFASSQPAAPSPLENTILQRRNAPSASTTSTITTVALGWTTTVAVSLLLLQWIGSTRSSDDEKLGPLQWLSKTIWQMLGGKPEESARSRAGIEKKKRRNTVLLHRGSCQCGSITFKVCSNSLLLQCSPWFAVVSIV